MGKAVQSDNRSQLKKKDIIDIIYRNNIMKKNIRDKKHKINFIDWFCISIDIYMIFKNWRFRIWLQYFVILIEGLHWHVFYHYNCKGKSDRTSTCFAKLMN